MDQAMDQANKLRQILESQQPSKLDLKARVIAVTSGKGGVGKSNVAINLAISLAMLDKKVVVVDADFGLANIEVLLGLIPAYSLEDVIFAHKTIEEILTVGPEGVKFISGGSGLQKMANLSPKDLARIWISFAQLDKEADVILVDTGAGISQTVMQFILAAEEAIIVVTPEPTSITDAYAVIKAISEHKESMDMQIIVNRVENIKEGLDVFEKLSNVSKQFLGTSLTYLGSILVDKYLVQAVKAQEPVVLKFPKSNFSRSIEEISHILLDKQKEETEGVLSFVKKFVSFFR